MCGKVLNIRMGQKQSVKVDEQVTLLGGIQCSFAASPFLILGKQVYTVTHIKNFKTKKRGF
jgi:hypothetical protein